MNRVVVVPSLLAAAFSATALAQKPMVVEASVRKAEMTNRESPPPIAPLGESVMLAAGAPKGAKLPDGLSEVAAGECSLGTQKRVIGVGKSSADAALPDRLFADLNGDGALGDDEQFPIEVKEQEARGGGKVQVAAPVDASFAQGTAQFAATLRYVKQGERTTLSVAFPEYLAADVEVGGEKRIVAMVDNDFDGKYGSAGDLWTLAKAGGQPANAYGMVGTKNRCFDNGHRVGVTVDGGKFLVRLEAAEFPDPADEAAQRVRVEHIWSERFDKEREGFVAQRKLDTSRPLTQKPVEWQYVTFDEAIAMGKKAGKPVFVDVMAFWCVWCYRMDYYTYPDQQVATMLANDFIPVKIVQEQARNGDYDRVMKDLLKARGIPAMGIFDGEGKLLHGIGGWKSPVDFITDLEAGKAKFK